MRKETTKKRDIEICKGKIKVILEEYNCILMSADEYSHVLLYDNDSYETVGKINPEKDGW